MSAANAKREQWAREASATLEELRARRTRPIYRRFRVEGSRAGNSRLLRRDGAEEARRRYGGTIVEVYPRQTREEKAASVARDMPACPRCKVPSGEPCIAASGNIREPHARRWDAYHEAQP